MVLTFVDPASLGLQILRFSCSLFFFFSSDLLIFNEFVQLEYVHQREEKKNQAHIPRDPLSFTLKA